MRLAAIAAATVALVAASPARADIVVCNDVPAAVSVALAYEDTGAVASQGWWRVAAQECRSLPFSPLDFFYTAESEKYQEGTSTVQHTWGRGRRFFVGSGRFKLDRAEQSRPGARQAAFTSFSVGQAYRTQPHIVTIRFRPGTTTVETRFK